MHINICKLHISRDIFSQHFRHLIANLTNEFIFSFLFLFLSLSLAHSVVAPEIDKTILRAASGEMERGRLPCRAQAAPAPKFVWTYNGQNLNVNKTWKYNVELKQIDPLTYESTLLIEKVGKTDYGNYECMARNELGSSKENVRLDITSKPDPPLSLNILNTTHDSVTVAWTPGFDGGRENCPIGQLARFRSGLIKHKHVFSWKILFVQA